MLREIITPQSDEYMIHIPKEYINTKVEILVLPFAYANEKTIQKSKNKSKISLRGVFNEYADSSKVALEYNAWKQHIIDKFKSDD